MPMAKYLFLACAFMFVLIGPTNGYPVPTPEIYGDNYINQAAENIDHQESLFRSHGMSASYLMALIILGALVVILVALIAGCLLINCLFRRQEARLDHLKLILGANGYDPNTDPHELMEVVVEKPGYGRMNQGVQEPETMESAPQLTGQSAEVEEGTAGNMFSMTGLFSNFMGSLLGPRGRRPEADLDPENPQEEEEEASHGQSFQREKPVKEKKKKKMAKKGSSEKKQSDENESESPEECKKKTDKSTHIMGTKSMWEKMLHVRPNGMNKRTKKHINDAKKSSHKDSKHHPHGEKGLPQDKDKHRSKVSKHLQKKADAGASAARSVHPVKKKNESAANRMGAVPKSQPKAKVPFKSKVQSKPKGLQKPKAPSKPKSFAKAKKLPKPSKPRKVTKKSGFGFFKRRRKEDCSSSVIH